MNEVDDGKVPIEYFASWLESKKRDNNKLLNKKINSQ
jgi:hypothetical protein